MKRKRKTNQELQIKILDFMFDSKEENLMTSTIAKAIKSNWPTTKKYMEILKQGLLLAAESMAATFVICAAMIGLMALIRLVASEKSGNQLDKAEDSEEVAVITAVTAVMGDTPWRVRSIRPVAEDGGVWERSVREELSRTEGGLYDPPV